MKKCKHCNFIKDFSCFYKDKNCKDNYGVKCKDCYKKYYNNNKEKILKIMKKKYPDKKEKLMLYDKKYRQENVLKIKKYRKEYKKQNSARYNFINNKRRAKKLKATPNWLSNVDIKNIENMYIKAKQLEKEDGILRHVDHIIPLQGKGVCGLHVPWNLQILTAKQNLVKNNRY